MTHKCNKEKELGVMQTDIKWIRKALEGNGNNGLIKETNLNTEFRMGAKGFMTAIILIASGLGSGIGWLCTKIFK